MRNCILYDRHPLVQVRADLRVAVEFRRYEHPLPSSGDNKQSRSVLNDPPDFVPHQKRVAAAPASLNAVRSENQLEGSPALLEVSEIPNFCEAASGQHAIC